MAPWNPRVPVPASPAGGWDLGFAGEGSGGKLSREAAVHGGSPKCHPGEQILEAGAASPGALPRREMLLMLSSPPIRGWSGRHRSTGARAHLRFWPGVSAAAAVSSSMASA